MQSAAAVIILLALAHLQWILLLALSPTEKDREP